MTLKSATYCFLLSAFYFVSACSPKTVPVVKKPEIPKVEEKTKENNTKKEQPIKKIKEKPEMVISLILPFELKSINYRTAEVADLRKAEIAIDFYQGFKMALDSVANQNSNVDFKLQVFDSNDNPTALGALAMKPAIKNSDLIIGPVFPNGIKAFSVYSKNMEKPMVSPLAASDPELFHNPYLITVNNSLDQHAYKAARFIKSDLKPKKVLLIRSGQADEYKYAIPFKKGMDSLAKGISVSELGIKAIGYENVYKHLNPAGLNVIVLPSTDRVFLLTIFKELEKASRNFQIAVIGHPGWEKATFLDFQQMERINAYLTSSYQIDYQSNRGKSFVNYYRSKFSLEPSEYAFKGFDIGYYFATLMNKKQHQFMDGLLNNSFDGIHNDFHFKKDSKTGYYNSSLMMLKYENAQLIKVD
ncbi:ABC transporter substrate-binding protein [Pedobacter arcticus]|uniref:ABC transporter substrate-binding protein n=1 Tax=Pedobacter arcticus TaxID=752140 RepID=UPI0003191F95|nr:ABC transporter substrate-binding protein [Pedobacter arcticus]